MDKKIDGYTIAFRNVGKGDVGRVGGKGANLGELSKIPGVNVPDGFCLPTETFCRTVGNPLALDGLLDQLPLSGTGDRDLIRDIAGAIRTTIETSVIPEDVVGEISRRLDAMGESVTYAVRSSATAEDLPTASFAGQHDSYLNVVGKESVLEHIRKCWASVFTERAIYYRIENGIGHHRVWPAVLIQKMIFPEAAGVLFTADPVSSNRKVLCINASFGLGESLVSGAINPDLYKVRDDRVLSKTMSEKKLGVYPSKGGGTVEHAIESSLQNKQTLSDEQIMRLANIGRKIEGHFGVPQDIEWCLVDDEFHVVQSRPITTLFPVPESPDLSNRVYISVGHQQMMTDPIKPLGLSFYLLTTNAPMRHAGGRLFVDVTGILTSPPSRENLLGGVGKSDPLMKDALLNILERGDFITTSPAQQSVHGSARVPASLQSTPAKFESDPTIVSGLMKTNEVSLKKLKHDIQQQSGVQLCDFIVNDIQQLKKFLTGSFDVIKAGMDASSWINEKMKDWLGEENPADTLSQSAPNNITSQMGLDLLDVADVIRPYPEVADYLQNAKGDNFLDGLTHLHGGHEAREIICRYLDTYGVRCAGEIDITRERWRENPRALVPMILMNIKNFQPHASDQKFELGRNEALGKERELIDRVSQLPDGDLKARETKRMIDVIRNFSGFREYPKYAMVQRYFVYKQALLEEAARLVHIGVLHKKEDIYFLTFEEFREVVSTKELDYRIIRQRTDEYKLFEKLTPPRVITSDGEVVGGRYRRENIPAGSIVGLPVSSGVIEGRARVILNMEDANLEDGDVLVTRFTDPSWTPLFLSAKALVTEVGGLMTHGAVIAREYGLPAVVGVEHATKLIKDGQRVRVHGTAGYIEILG